MSVDKLLTQIEWTVPNTGLQQFWRDNPNFENKTVAQAEELAPLRNHYFSHDMVARIVPVNFLCLLFQSVLGACKSYLCQLRQCKRLRLPLITNRIVIFDIYYVMEGLPAQSWEKFSTAGHLLIPGG